MMKGFVLEETPPWSLRRFWIWRQCRRAYALRYLVLTAHAQSSTDLAFQEKADFFLSEHPFPLHWTSQILSSTLRTVNGYRHVSSDILKRVIARDWRDHVQLPPHEIPLRLKQLSEVSWFELVSGYLQRPLQTLMSTQVESFSLGSLRILMLPATVFWEGEVAFSIRPVLDTQDGSQLIADALQTFLIPMKTARTIYEVRLRKLLIPLNPSDSAHWSEKILTEKELFFAAEQIATFAQMMIPPTGKHFTLQDFPKTENTGQCSICPLQKLCGVSE